MHRGPPVQRAQTRTTIHLTTMYSPPSRSVGSSSPIPRGNRSICSVMSPVSCRSFSTGRYMSEFCVHAQQHEHQHSTNVADFSHSRSRRDLQTNHDVTNTHTSHPSTFSHYQNRLHERGIQFSQPTFQTCRLPVTTSCCSVCFKNS